MLLLLDAPAWAPAGHAPEALPPTLPAALLVVLAAQPGWMARERLALVFWPDAAPADALHHLRINLHRARALLQRWGQADALQAERSRLQLSLPTDLAGWRQALQAGAAASIAQAGPGRWLQDWRLPGHTGFSQWCEDLAAQLQRDWLAAAAPARTAPTAWPAPTDTGSGALPGARAARGAAPPPLRPDAPPGREDALAELLHSPAPALLLLGEPGAGKTTLLRAAWPQAPCLRGLQGLRAMPYRPLLETLRAHLDPLQRALRDPGHALRPYRLDLARLLPELAPDEALPALDALTAQARQVEALARAFEALTPVLLVDDLQWCDAATVAWLVMLAHAGRLRWRAVARRGELPADTGQALQGLRDARLLHTLDLAPLDRAGLARACVWRWPQQRFDADTLDRLQALSGGNPFLLGELVAVGLPAAEGLQMDQPLLDRAGLLLRRQLDRLPAGVRLAAEAAAVFNQPVPADALRSLAGWVDSPAGAPADNPVDGPAQALPWPATLDRARAAGLLRAEPDGQLRCGHDLIRQVLADGLAPARRVLLHRHAALWLAQRDDADALTIADHWVAAGEDQTALAWQHRAADRFKTRGDFEPARQLWQRVAEQSLDAAQALRARLELAACDLFDDLARGQSALEAVRAQLAAVADAEQHRQIEGRVLAALVDNRVFAGDLPAAAGHARRLRALLPRLPAGDRPGAIESLIELAMREPDIDAAWGLLAQLRQIDPRRPSLLSFEGQIHWFGGQVQAAHDALALLLRRHPEHCRGLTIENDLAVMLQALGDLAGAEAMARRSLATWAGVPHTQALSLLVLGLTLSSAGRCDEADAALRQALALAREQRSAGFEAEALVRHARLLLQCGRLDAARQALAQATPLLQASSEPMRVSQWALACVQAACAGGQAVPDAVLQRLRAVAARSAHPLVQTRLARVQAELALASGDWRGALAAAERQAEQAQQAGLPEPLAEAWLLQARARRAAGAPDAQALGLLRQAEALAERHGLLDLQWRAADGLASAGDTAAAARACAALARLQGPARPGLFDAAAAARREPCWR